MAEGLADIEHTSGLKPALINIEGGWQIGYLLEHPFGLPDCPGFQRVALLTSVMFDTCFHLIIMPSSSPSWEIDQLPFATAPFQLTGLP
jgi:hypothetical protein